MALILIDVFICADADEIIELVMEEKEIDVTPWWVEEEEKAAAAAKSAVDKAAVDKAAADKAAADKAAADKAAAARRESAKVIKGAVIAKTIRIQTNSELSREELLAERDRAISEDDFLLANEMKTQLKAHDRSEIRPFRVTIGRKSKSAIFEDEASDNVCVDKQVEEAVKSLTNRDWRIRFDAIQELSRGLTIPSYLKEIQKHIRKIGKCEEDSNEGVARGAAILVVEIKQAIKDAAFDNRPMPKSEIVAELGLDTWGAPKPLTTAGLGCMSLNPNDESVVHPRHRYVHILDIEKALGSEASEKLKPNGFKRLSLTPREGGYAWSTLALALRLGFSGSLCLPSNRLSVKEIRVRIQLQCQNKSRSVAQLLKDKASNAVIEPAPTAEELSFQLEKMSENGALNENLASIAALGDGVMMIKLMRPKVGQKPKIHIPNDQDIMVSLEQVHKCLGGPAYHQVKAYMHHGVDGGSDSPWVAFCSGVQASVVELVASSIPPGTNRAENPTLLGLGVFVNEAALQCEILPAPELKWGELSLGPPAREIETIFESSAAEEAAVGEHVVDELQVAVASTLVGCVADAVCRDILAGVYR